MLLLSLLLVSALELQGTLDMTLDPAVYPTFEGRCLLEVAYDIPHASLSFLRSGDGYVARFRAGIDLIDTGGDPVAGSVWEKQVDVAEYDLTIAPDASVSGVLSLMVPDGADRARVQVADLSSDRHVEIEFRVEPVESGVRLRFLKAGRYNPARTYGRGDTLAVRAEVLTPGIRPDSIRFMIRDGRRVAAARTIAVRDSSGRISALLTLPLADSTGGGELSRGEHTLEAAGVGGDTDIVGRATFRLEVPFYYDDDAWRERVEELLWVADPNRMAELRGLPAGEREAAWREFWKGLDPTPTTEVNERELTYFERIEYCREQFGHGDRGYKSDRARVYVKLGPPAQIDSRPFEIDSHAYEVWAYYRLGLEFVFVDRSGFGEFILESPRYWDEK